MPWKLELESLLKGKKKLFFIRPSWIKCLISNKLLSYKCLSIIYFYKKSYNKVKLFSYKLHFVFIGYLGDLMEISLKQLLDM